MTAQHSGVHTSADSPDPDDSVCPPLRSLPAHYPSLLCFSLLTLRCEPLSGTALRSPQYWSLCSSSKDDMAENSNSRSSLPPSDYEPSMAFLAETVTPTAGSPLADWHGNPSPGLPSDPLPYLSPWRDDRSLEPPPWDHPALDATTLSTSYFPAPSTPSDLDLPRWWFPAPPDPPLPPHPSSPRWWSPTPPRPSPPTQLDSPLWWLQGRPTPSTAPTTSYDLNPFTFSTQQPQDEPAPATTCSQSMTTASTSNLEHEADSNLPDPTTPFNYLDDYNPTTTLTSQEPSNPRRHPRPEHPREQITCDYRHCPRHTQPPSSAGTITGTI
jgi:hypothetical protein